MQGSRHRARLDPSTEFSVYRNLRRRLSLEPDGGRDRGRDDDLGACATGDRDTCARRRFAHRHELVEGDAKAHPVGDDSACRRPNIEVAMRIAPRVSQLRVDQFELLIAQGKLGRFGRGAT